MGTGASSRVGRGEKGASDDGEGERVDMISRCTEKLVFEIGRGLTDD